jgi:isoleucyl-tRNA synthetase
MDAGHFVGRHGADIVRLWVSSVNYTDDVPFSEEMFTRLGDTYRRIRNTLRILLGNLHDFAPGKTEFSLVDRWILDRLQEVIENCRAAYAVYEFHKVYHALNQFCAVDLSSLTSISPRTACIATRLIPRAGGDAGRDAPDLRSALSVAGSDPRFYR